MFVNIFIKQQTMENKKIKLAVLRQPEINPCPFGLPIPFGCLKAGESVRQMIPMALSQQPSIEVSQNLQILNWESDGNHCLYAKDIIEQKQTVNCTMEIPESTDAIIGSPFYYKPFAGMGFDGHTSVPLGYYTDTSIDRGMYYGMYSMESIASEEEELKQSK